ncbi:DinB family protein [Rhodocytophaga rosea]|uniref:DinB family protein n=1 Tax=Rhodocytophaga rosea TaxID=2704465 RepID=A0A6C0GC45_9BACT|nr:DinB family protein [Rhodocytophaga rosea]QHT65549.1 DinB family protein [Rhodocytophaga rosea]
MNQPKLPEVWLRGPVAGVTPLLQPVAHALLQAREEVSTYVADFPAERLWEKPARMASVGFHLMHLTGVLDRLFTYAQGQTLSADQLKALSQEGSEPFAGCTAEDLAGLFSKQVDKSLAQLRETNEQTLLEPRGVGRAQLPSTTLGLLFHAAEHTQRHVGQLLVTARIVRNMY